MSRANVAAVAAMYEAFNRGDLQAILAMLDPHVQWSVAEGLIYADGNPYRGPEGVARLLTRIPADWKDPHAEVEDILDAGDTVAGRGRYRATHRHTGKTIDAQFIQIIKLRAGKIVSFQQYTDTAQFRDAAAPSSGGGR